MFVCFCLFLCVCVCVWAHQVTPGTTELVIADGAGQLATYDLRNFSQIQVSLSLSFSLSLSPLSSISLLDACVYKCLYVCGSLSVCVIIHLLVADGAGQLATYDLRNFSQIQVSLSLSVCVCVCGFLSLLHLLLSLRYSRMCVCIYVCMYVCVYVCVCVCLSVGTVVPSPQAPHAQHQLSGPLPPPRGYFCLRTQNICVSANMHAIVIVFCWCCFDEDICVSFDSINLCV